MTEEMVPVVDVKQLQVENARLKRALDYFISEVRNSGEGIDGTNVWDHECEHVQKILNGEE